MAFSKDTRTLRRGDTYVAIRGERFDGHAFVGEAVAKGAAGVAVEEAFDADGIPAHVEVIRVGDAVTWLAESAREKIARLRPDVVAITGSVGKTSTRSAIATVLARKFPVLASEGNLNTVLGLSLTVLNGGFDVDSKLVLEMGACNRGDIAELCGYFPPTVSVVTNVHGVHLESFGTMEEVARTKGEIVAALPESGTACLHADDPRVRAMERLHGGRTIFYGSRAEVSPRDITVELPLLGEHAVKNALAAIAVGRALGMDTREINEGLALLRPEKGRLCRLPGKNGSTLVDDSYNASPTSTLAALRVLADLRTTRAVAFLGDMLELGEPSHREHVRILRAALASADRVYAVGELMQAAAWEVGLGGAQFATSREAAHAVCNEMAFTPGDIVLVKGSQGARMERISRALLREDVLPESVLVRHDAAWLDIEPPRVGSVEQGRFSHTHPVSDG